VALDLGRFKIYWYGILVAAGFLAGLWTASRRGLRERIAAEKIIEFGPWLLIGTVIGARALYVISYWREAFARKPLTEIFIVRSGLVFYGGLMRASLAVVLKARVDQLRLLSLAGLPAPSLALRDAL